jgi:hypothetical protein
MPEGRLLAASHCHSTAPLGHAPLGHSWDTGHPANDPVARQSPRKFAVIWGFGGGRGRYRTADRWCVNPGRTVHSVSCGAVPSRNAQLNGPLVFTLSQDCRAVFVRLGTLLAQRGFGRRPTAPGGRVPRKRQGDVLRGRHFRCLLAHCSLPLMLVAARSYEANKKRAARTARDGQLHHGGYRAAPTTPLAGRCRFVGWCGRSHGSAWSRPRSGVALTATAPPFTTLGGLARELPETHGTKRLQV